MGWFFRRDRNHAERGGASRAIRLLACGATFASVALASGSADAYEIKRTARGELVHWESTSIGYVLDPSVEAAVPTGGDAVLGAIGSWSGSVGAPELTAKPGVAPATPGYDGTNAIYFMKDGWAPAGRALAITVLTYDSNSGRILDADIIFNGKYRFAVLTEPNAADVARAGDSATRLANTDGISHIAEDATPETALYDLHHVIAHEVGHSLGMNDELGRKDALMYRYSTPNDASTRAPMPDDIAGLAELYSATLDAKGSGCGANVAPKKPGARLGSAAMFAALGLLLFLVLRARTDKRARLGFVVTAAASALLLLPSADDAGPRVVQAAELAPGQARAHVTSAHTVVEGGLFRTEFQIQTDACRRNACPPSATGSAWGGTVGNLRQEIGGYYAPTVGDAVDVSYDKLPDALAPLANPLGGRATLSAAGVVRVLTRAN